MHSRLIFNIFQVGLSVASSIIVLRLHFRGHKTQKLPKLLKKILKLEVKVKKTSNELFNKDMFYYGQTICNGYLPNEICFHKFINRYDSNSSKIKINDQIKNNYRKSQNDPKIIIFLIKALKSIKSIQKKIIKSGTPSIPKLKLLIEWKEAAARLDNIFLVISILTVTLTPAFMFGKYIFEDSGFQPCRCL